MKELVLIKKPEDWDKAIPYAARRIKEGETVILIVDEGVRRCVRCEPELFKVLHQFILDGGRALVCLKSLKEHGIPASRPPDVLERVEDGRAFIKKKQSSGYRITTF